MKKVLYLFGQLSDDDVEWMLEFGRLVRLAKNEVLIAEDTHIQALFVVLEGTLTVSELSRDIAEVGVGETLGEMSFVDSRPASATVRANGDVLLFELRREALEAQFAQDTRFAAAFYRALCMFLSDRLRAIVDTDGSGTSDELDLNVMDELSSAGARFDRLLRRVHAR